MDTDDGRADLNRLLALADVLVHDLGPAAAGALGLDDTSLAQRFTWRLVVMRSTFAHVATSENDRPLK